MNLLKESCGILKLWKLIPPDDILCTFDGMKVSALVIIKSELEVISLLSSATLMPLSISVNPHLKHDERII